MVKLKGIVNILSAVLLLVLISGCASLGLSPVKDRMLESVKYSDRELAAAESENRAIISKYGTVNDSQGINRLNSINNRIKTVLPRQDIDFKIHILNSDDINAMTAGGRHIYIFKGLLDNVRSDDELACVIAHEMAHSMLRHRAKRTTIGILTALGGIAASIAMQDQETAQNVVALAAQALPATFSREDEKEADVLAAVFAHEAGYDASKAEYFFKMLAEKERAYNMEVSSKLLPVLNAATANYNAALNNYNAWANQYNLAPNQNNYNGLLNAKNQLDYHGYQIEKAKAAYLNFALGNIGWFRTHPDSMSRADMFVKMSDYMSGKKSIEELGNYDRSVVNILTALHQIQDLSRQGLLDKSGVKAMELFKRAQALYNNRNFLAANNTLKEVLRLKPDYQDAIRLQEDLDSYVEYFIENLEGKREREVLAVLGNPIESRRLDSDYIRKKYDFDGRIVSVYFKDDVVNRWIDETSR